MYSVCALNSTSHNAVASTSDLGENSTRPKGSQWFKCRELRHGSECSNEVFLSNPNLCYNGFFP